MATASLMSVTLRRERGGPSVGKREGQAPEHHEVGVEADALDAADTRSIASA